VIRRGRDALQPKWPEGVSLATGRCGGLLAPSCTAPWSNRR
jgi:hypothetical protein